MNIPASTLEENHFVLKVSEVTFGLKSFLLCLLWGELDKITARNNAKKTSLCKKDIMCKACMR